MKICLIDTNIAEKSWRKLSVNFPTGLLLLGSILERNNFDVKIVNLGWLIEQGGLSIDKRFHINAAKIIIEQKAEILGFTTRCDIYPSVLNIAKRCKELNPKIIIILGGPQATFVDRETLEVFPFIDVIVRGEGELTIVELLDKLKNKQSLGAIAGVSYRENGKIVRNRDREPIGDLDLLPFPAYHLIEENISDKNIKNRWVNISVGRGCCYKCIFCCSSLMFKNFYRLRSPESIIREIIFLKEKYGANNFLFEHDYFLLSKNLVEEICEFLLQKKIDIIWGCNSRIDDIDFKLMKKLVKSGLRTIYFGIESGSCRIQGYIKKNINITSVYNVIKECGNLGVKTTLSFIIGFPEEKKEDVNRTLELALRLRQLTSFIQIHLLGPMSGTALLERNKDRLIFTGKWSDVSGGPTIELEENIDLIKKYPSIFSAFYEFKPKYLPKYFPYETVILFSGLIFLYPITSYLVIKEIGFEPVDLLEDIKKWMRKKRLFFNQDSVYNKVKERLYEKINIYFPLFIEDIYKRRKIPFDFLKLIMDRESKQASVSLAKYQEIIA